MSNIYQVPAGHTIAITPTAGVPVHARRLDDATIGAVVRVSQTFGPYLSDCEFVVGAPATVTVAIAAASDSIAGMLMFGDVAHRGGAITAVERQRQQGSAGVVAAGGHLHGHPCYGAGPPSTAPGDRRPGSGG